MVLSEIRDFTDMILAADTFSGSGPGTIPFDWAVDFPVREDEVDFGAGVPVSLQELFYLLPDYGNTMFEGKGATECSAA